MSGACSSIGRGIAIRFVRECAKTALIDSDATKGAELVKQIEAAGGTAKFFQCDVAAKGEARRAIDEAVKAFGGLYVLANCNWRQTAWTAFESKAEESSDLRRWWPVPQRRCIRTGREVSIGHSSAIRYH